MGVEDIVDRILKDAEKEAKKIKAEGMEKAKAILGEAATKAGKITAGLAEDAKIKAANEEKRSLAQARMISRKRVLEARQRLIDEAFDRAIDEIVRDERYKEAVRKTLLSVVASLEPGEEGEVAIAPKDKAITKSFLGRCKGITLSEKKADIKGGFILSTKDAVYDQSLESIVAARRDELELAVAKILFSED